MAALTYLQLVNRARQEAGAGGVALSSLGGTISAETQRYKDWVNEGWRELQVHCKTWDFMRGDFSFDTSAGTQTYTAATLSTPLTSFRDWKRDSFRAYLTATGFADEQLLGFMDWESFRNLYLFGTQRTQQARPVCFAIRPNKQLVIGPVPDNTYTIVGEYFRMLTDLSADGDTPTITEEYHMLPVWRAVRSAGLFDAAAEVVIRANAEIGRLMSKIEADQQPEIGLGAPLA